MTTTTATVIESATRNGCYGLPYTEAIVEHSTHGRIYLTMGYGGTDSPRGSLYRWNQGKVSRVKADDTLATLHIIPDDMAYSPAMAMAEGRDDERPFICAGWAVESVARQAGLA